MFCQTWEEPGALHLIAPSTDKHRIHKDEHPQIVEIEACSART